MTLPRSRSISLVNGFFFFKFCCICVLSQWKVSASLRVLAKGFLLLYLMTSIHCSRVNLFLKALLEAIIKHQSIMETAGKHMIDRLVLDCLLLLTLVHMASPTVGSSDSFEFPPFIRGHHVYLET